MFICGVNKHLFDLTWLDFDLKTRACTSNQAYHALHEFDGTTRDLYVPRPNGRGNMTGPRTCLISPKKTVCIGSLLIISMLWHRIAIFESKEDKLCSSAACMIRTQCIRYQIASKLNARWQTDWSIEDQAKKLQLDSPSLWSASIQPTQPNTQLAFTHGSGDIHVCWC